MKLTKIQSFNEWIDCNCERKEEKLNIVIDKKAPLEKIVNLLNNRSMEIKAIKKYLLNEYEYAQEEQINKFLKELLDNQILCSDLRINMLSVRTINWLIEKISLYEDTESIIDQLKNIYNELENYQNDLINQEIKN